MFEMHEWCMLGFEEAPGDVEEEEEHKKWIDPTKFEATHGTELKQLKTKMHKGMAIFTSLLSKFDAENPDFSEMESKIMSAMLNQSGMSYVNKTTNVTWRLGPPPVIEALFVKKRNTFMTVLSKSKALDEAVEQSQDYRSFKARVGPLEARLKMKWAKHNKARDEAVEQSTSSPPDDSKHIITPLVMSPSGAPLLVRASDSASDNAGASGSAGGSASDSASADTTNDANNDDDDDDDALRTTT
jgi:hypothetical protein